MKSTYTFQVDRHTLQRVRSGEQTEIYLNYCDYWTRKLHHPKTLQPRRFRYVILSNGTGTKKETVRVTIYAISSKERGRVQWTDSDAKVYVLYIQSVLP